LRKLLFSLSLTAAGNKGRKALRALRSFMGTVKISWNDMELGIEPATGTADSGDLEHDLSDLLVAVGEAAAEKDTAVALCIDEMQYLNQKEFSALIMALHKVSQLNLPLIVVGAGLPQILGSAGESKSYAERLFDYPPVGTLSDVERATDQAIAALDQSFFRVRFDRCTPSEKRYMRALADLGEGAKRSGDIADRLGVKVTSVGPTRSKLITKGDDLQPATWRNGIHRTAI
jgi:hypothetical protein